MKNKKLGAGICRGFFAGAEAEDVVAGVAEVAAFVVEAGGTSVEVEVEIIVDKAAEEIEAAGEIAMIGMTGTIEMTEGVRFQTTVTIEMTDDAIEETEILHALINAAIGKHNTLTTPLREKKLKKLNTFEMITFFLPKLQTCTILFSKKTTWFRPGLRSL